MRLRCSFIVANQRQPVAFALFRNISAAANFSSADIVARSPAIEFANYNEPTQGHLALTGAAGWAPVHSHAEQGSCEHNGALLPGQTWLVLGGPCRSPGSSSRCTSFKGQHSCARSAIAVCTLCAAGSSCGTSPMQQGGGPARSVQASLRLCGRAMFACAGRCPCSGSQGTRPHPRCTGASSPATTATWLPAAPPPTPGKVRRPAGRAGGAARCRGQTEMCGRARARVSARSVLADHPTRSQSWAAAAVPPGQQLPCVLSTAASLPVPALVRCFWSGLP